MTELNEHWVMCSKCGGQVRIYAFQDVAAERIPPAIHLECADKIV